jgi:hypothetical protein
MFCSKCGDDYDKESRVGKPGKVTECELCAEEVAVKYTGNVIFDHKTAACIQINKDPALTAYINAATKLQCKGRNLGNNLKVNSTMAKSYGACHSTAGEKTNVKGRL